MTMIARECALNSDIRILLVGDQNLGATGLHIVRNYFSDVTCVIWQRGDVDGEGSVRQRIGSQRWDLLLSFYNDLIFSGDELARTDIALNIHPASPRLRGVGYDTLPLLWGHSRYSATLHRITTEIDAGEIIDVMDAQMPDGLTHSQLRKLTQQQCLEMLDITCKAMHHFKSKQQLNQYLDSKAAQQSSGWSRRYMSRKRLQSILDELRCLQPDHSVFQ